MREIFFCATLLDGRQVCVAPLSRQTFEANDAHQLGDDYGYFIYEVDTRRPGSGIEILAKTASYQAAIRLIDIYELACRARPSAIKVARSAHSLETTERS